MPLCGFFLLACKPSRGKNRGEWSVNGKEESGAQELRNKGQWAEGARRRAERTATRKGTRTNADERGWGNGRLAARRRRRRKSDNETKSGSSLRLLRLSSIASAEEGLFVAAALNAGLVPACARLLTDRPARSPLFAGKSAKRHTCFHAGHRSSRKVIRMCPRNNPPE